MVKTPNRFGAGVFAYENRKGVTYYLHEGRTKTGKPRYFVARSIGEGALSSVPDGYELTESVNGVVSVRRRHDSRNAVPPDDLALVQAELRHHEQLRHHRAIAERDAIVIYAPSVDEAEERRVARELGFAGRADDFVAVRMKQARYDPVMKLVRTDAGYSAHRMTYRGHGGWSWVLCSGPLQKVVRAVVPTIGKPAFFELM